MKYFTKQWYNEPKLILPFKLEIIQTDENDIEKIFQNEYKKSFEETKNERPYETEQDFEEHFKRHLEDVKKFFSTHALNSVKDIRLLALGKVFKKEYDIIEKEIIKKDKIQAYYKYYQTIKDKLPKDIDEKLDLHDCLITNIIKEKDKHIIELDCSKGYGDINRLIFKNYKIKQEQTDFKNKWWLYEEIYIVDNKYELHAMTTGSRDGLAYLTIQAEEIIIE